MRNLPFYAAPATPADFVGRRRERTLLVNGLRGHRLFVLQGPPGLGKSSLLGAVAHDLSSFPFDPLVERRPRPICVACDKGMSLEQVLVALVDAAAKGRPLDPARLEAARQDARDRRLGDALARLDDGDTHPVLLVDRAHNLDDDAFRALSSLLNRLLDDHRIAVVLCVTGDRLDSGRLLDSPWRAHLDATLVLSPLGLPETALLLDLARDAGWTLAPGCADAAWEVTRGHPYRLRVLLERACLASTTLTPEHLRTTLHAADHARLDAILGGGLPAMPPVYVSYRKTDVSERDQLIEHIEAMGVRTWCDRQIPDGVDWDAENRAAMAEARVAILLITAAYLNSRYILDQEVVTLFARRKDGLVVIPVVARDCAWQMKFAVPQVWQKGRVLWTSNREETDRNLAHLARHVASLLRRS